MQSLSAYLRTSAEQIAASACAELDAAFTQAVTALSDALLQGKPVLVCGNGGSMADAQHIAGELVARFRLNRKALPVIALGSTAATLTAWGNDIDFVSAFAREVEAFGQPGAVLLAISTSGNSANVLLAIEQAKRMEMSVVGLSGGTGGHMAQVCDILLCPRLTDTPRIQEVHTPIYHLLCEQVEARCAAADAS